MKMPDISEEERAEIFRALQERKEALEKLEKDTDKRGIPIDRIDERLALYRDGESLENGKRVPTAGLLTMFSAEPQLSDEARRQRDEEDEIRRNAATSESSGETGGGNKAGGKAKWKRQRKPGEPETVGEILGTEGEPIAPPPPQRHLALEAKGSPSNNDNILDPTGPTPPSPEAVDAIRTARLMGEEEGADGKVEELAAAASGAHPSGAKIADDRTDTKPLQE